jgi:para-aminobenzoate synthetase/4-amino-4-deoxychorismate lyase
MKGTMPRGLDSAEDDLQAQRLAADEKNRSEHIMIVDLLRNDLGRLCQPGTIVANPLFAVEHYRTLLQMTSTITGTLRPHLSYEDIFRALFPSGSITGAPKIRTMQIIRELERHPRGIYTGAIGYIAPNRNATFNVAIRTLVFENHYTTMGVGGGIVADSTAADEYRECLLKAGFLTRPHNDCALIETMRIDRNLHVAHLALHLDRLQSSAQYFDYPFDRADIESRIHAHARQQDPHQQHRLRLTLSSTGAPTLTSTPFTPSDAPIKVLMATHRTRSTDLYLRHKTDHRVFYDALFAQAQSQGYDEVLFLNERGELTEGAISNLFLERNGELLTPPLTSGVLPGILRRHILDTHPNAREQTLYSEDLAHADFIYLGNSLRGLRRVHTIVPAEHFISHTP